MFSNIIPCYNKYLSPNETLYLEVRNSCKFYLYISLEYKINDRLVTRQSPVFAPGQFQRLTFPSGASRVYFRAFECEDVPPGMVCAKYIKNYRSSCYKITGRSIGDILCTKVTC